MKELCTVLVVFSFLVFLALGNALSRLYPPESVRSFRLRRREYLTQVLKQIATVTKCAKACKSKASAHGFSKETLKQDLKHYSSKNAWFWSFESIESESLFPIPIARRLFSILNGPPLLRPPIV
jgi:hypothetical protein